MRKRIFWGTYLLVMISVVIALVVSSILIYREMYEGMQVSARRQAEIISQVVEGQGVDGLKNLPLRAENERITLITPKGEVLFDTREDTERLTNHLSRPEVQEALRTGKGEGKRESQTLQQSIFYYAMQMEDGNIVRISQPMKGLFAAMADSLVWLVVFLIGMLLVAYFAAGGMTKRLIAPINAMDLDAPEPSLVYPELEPLVRKMNQQNKKITHQLEEIEERQQETTFFIENMQEGIVLLDQNQRLTKVNSSAIDLLKAPKVYYEGKNLLTLSRNLTLLESVEKSLEGEYQEAVLHIEDRTVQLHCSPIWNGTEVEGVVCFFMDITQREQAEQIRREFSANVSHELRTPLTSISGYAEIMKNGMVQAKDMENFASKIYDEAQQLIYLVDDIMKLSQLDEGGDSLTTTSVNLEKIATDVVNRLTPLAEQKNISLVAEGTAAPMEGVEALLSEVIYNLVDNSIKYSESGTVRVLLSYTPTENIVEVTDEGIGIPATSQDRVFERFYQVDESHNATFEGTGLGLAIVKHGVNYHGGVIELSSTPGEGTSIRLLFPR